MRPETELSPRMPRWLRFTAYSVAVPVSNYALFCAYMASMMGGGAILDSGRLLPGIFFIMLAGLAVWYVYALIVSLWFSHGGVAVGSGLAIGFLILAWFVGVIGLDACSRITSHKAWSAKNYAETFGFGGGFLLGLLLTGFLLVRMAFADRLGNRQGARY